MFSRGAVFGKKQRIRSRFGGTTNRGSSKMAPAPPKEPLKRSHAKHPISVKNKDLDSFLRSKDLYH
jgi:hypothetical protein